METSLVAEHAPAGTGMEAYLPIEEHGVIGDLRTVALVGTNGTIDWYCPGRFDAPSVFGALLDRRKGGCFRIAPAHGGWTSRQLYFPETNILITRFLSEEGVTEVIDFMPVPEQAEPDDGRLVRTVLAIRGSMPMRVSVEPRFDYAREGHEANVIDGAAVFRSARTALGLSSRVPLHEHDGDVHAEFTLEPDERATFVLETLPDGAGPRRYSEVEARELFKETIDYWRNWLRGCRYTGRWREMVHRSALTLKLLTYEPSGAIVAAATTSLPEQLGGERNWDYRFTWIRDASFSLYGLLRLGFQEEAGAFMDWLTDRFKSAHMERESGPLQIMYGIDGRESLVEETLDHLEGYRGSAPVRVGNGAAEQLQLDIYGELIDSVYLYNKGGRPIYHEAWENLSAIVEWVTDHWDQADEGIWETRGGRQHFTYSRLMSWVAVERAIRVARQRGLPADLVEWTGVRDKIYHQIMSRGWHPDRGAFVQHYDTDVLDASVLLMPLVKFISPTDPRWLSTLDAITKELVSDSLVYRYNASASPDGLAGDEGTFSICSFWWVEALARAGRLDEARIAFEKMLTYANHLGLYSEEIGPTGEQLGNFPQAFTHLSLISAAFNLDRQLG
ncbi:MAG TPA: glycoside hydrolase family 15 protein [Gaiellaceae bacterium]|nr:glycoside hydrolase family 15 protein [Gaiellaceae bacterium]